MSGGRSLAGRKRGEVQAGGGDEVWRQSEDGGNQTHRCVILASRINSDACCSKRLLQNKFAQTLIFI